MDVDHEKLELDSVFLVMKTRNNKQPKEISLTFALE